MARYHYWQFIVNQEGQPIRNVAVSLYLAGTNIPAFIYRSEFGTDGTNTPPQVYTNKAGYFEFWLGDDTQTEGYPIGQKFKIQWEKENVASGSIDWVDIFPGFAPVDETDNTSTIKNKLVSNALAYDWDQHVQHQDVTVGAYPIFSQVEITDDPFYEYDIVHKGYVDDLMQGMVWQNPVISFSNPTSGLPKEVEVGDRYVSSATTSGADYDWNEDYIYEYSEHEEWVEIVPEQGYSLLVEDEDRWYNYNGDEWVKFSAGFAWYQVSSNTYLENRKGYLVDCSSSAITLTMPSNPEMGDRIDVLDYTGSSNANNITLDGNGNLVEEQSSFTIDVDGAGLQMVYTTSTYGWKVINEVYA